MKLFIVYAGVEDRLSGWPDDRSLALQRLAGSNVLGHVLNQLSEIHTHELVVIVDKGRQEVAAWFAETIPGLEVKVVAVAAGSSQIQALCECRHFLDNGPLLVALGSMISEADYKGLAQSTADVTLFTQPPAGLSAQDEGGPPWAGVCCFRQGTDLRAALDSATAGTNNFVLFLNELRQRDLHIEEQAAMMCLETSTVEGLLFANARLLGLGYGSDDAIERSYVEDFTVIPPVFLHETAVIENAVVGPFANIEAGARIKNSVIRNSLIGEETTIDNAVLDGSLIGARARLKASGSALIVEDEGQILL